MDKKDYFKNSKFVTELKPSDFKSDKVWELKNRQCCVILFYSPWCGYCKKTKGAWEKLGKLLGFYDVLAFNCEKYKGHCLKIQHDMPELIAGYPSIIIYKNGKPVEKIGQNDDERTVTKLTSAVMRVCA